jgi:hypothetical protein
MSMALATATRTTGRDDIADSARPYRGRRMLWREFYALRPDLRPANDNGGGDARLRGASQGTSAGRDLR